jgi:hypothetical protein
MSALIKTNKVNALNILRQKTNNKKEQTRIENLYILAMLYTEKKLLGLVL